MKKELLEKGNAILKEIAELKKHLSETFPTPVQDRHQGYDPYSFEYSKLEGKEDVIPKFRAAPFFSGGNSKELRNEFVPFPIDSFMNIYKAKVQEKIALLEKEFDSLV
jgi:hypothetical protein